MGLMIFCYRLSYPILWVTARILSFFVPKLKQGFQLRQIQQGIKPWLNHPQNTQPIWFHCSSGEFEYAKPVIRKIKQERPDLKILVTYFSPSVVTSLKSNTDVDFYCPTPWDTAKQWQEFIRYHQPRMLLVARTDLWPMMLWQNNQNKVPQLLFSKTVNEKKSIISKLLTTPLYKLFDDIFCATIEDQKSLLKQLKPYNTIHAAGDTRYDQCLYRLQHAKPLKPLKNFLKPTLIAGSTWSEDEKVLIETATKCIKEISFVIVPHEPSSQHIAKLQSQLKGHGVSSQLYSQTTNWNPESILIVDQIGILAELYKWGQMAFVGGSMNRSVHSVMEPLALGLFTFVGPKHHNNREALTFKNEKALNLPPVQVIRNSKELTSKLQNTKELWTEQHAFEIRQSIKQKTGASEIVFRWVKNHL